jgi:plasmid maintenance system killer protein
MRLLNGGGFRKLFRHAEFISASIVQKHLSLPEKWTLKQVQGDEKRCLDLRLTFQHRTAQ